MGMASQEEAEGLPGLDELGAGDNTPITRGSPDVGGGDDEGYEEVSGGRQSRATEEHNLRRGIQQHREENRRLQGQIAEMTARQQAAMDRVTAVLQARAHDDQRRAYQEQQAQWEAQQRAMAAQAAAQDPEPDQTMEHEAWLAWKIRQMENAIRWRDEREQQYVQYQAELQQASARDKSISDVMSDVAQFETRYTTMVQPDYMDAFNFVANHRIAFWRAAGVPDDMIFGKDGVLEAEKGWLFRSCLRPGTNGKAYEWTDLPPRRLYQLAQHLGYGHNGMMSGQAGAAAGAVAGGGDPRMAMQQAAMDEHAAQLMSQGVPRRGRRGPADGRMAAMQAGARANIGNGGRPSAAPRAMSYEDFLQLDDSDLLYLMQHDRGSLDNFLGKGQ